MLRLVKITGRIRVETGLRIGGNKDNVNIGGVDSIVITNPVDKKPYIPGSSIKGKMRFLMEWKYEKVKDGKVHNCNDKNCKICGLFGSSKFEQDGIPTRLIVRDALLSEGFREKDVLEEKVENYIDRLTGRAGSPRTMQRVVPGTEFDLEMVLRIFDGDDENKWIDLLLEAMALLQSDYLGGSGSRGYGKIVFVSKEGQERKVNIGDEERDVELKTKLEE